MTRNIYKQDKYIKITSKAKHIIETKFQIICINNLRVVQVINLKYKYQNEKTYIYK